MAPKAGRIDKLDFPSSNDPRQPLLHPNGGEDSSRPSNETSRAGSFLDQVAEGIQEQDRERVLREVVRYGSFAWGVIACLCAGSVQTYSLYGHLFQTRLKYDQLQVNLVSIVLKIAMYIFVPVFGYVCDRRGPGLPSLVSGILFGFGYILAAFTYKSGPPPTSGGDGWPFWIMIVSFVAIGTATAGLYLSALATCAKNCGRGRYRGIALAIPITCIGLSGMWQSQVGSRLLYEIGPDGSKDVDVHRYFLFLGCLLAAVGIIGTVALRVVDEGEMIDQAVEELEQSGLLAADEYFQRAATQHGYGTLTDPTDLSESQYDFIRNKAEEMKILEMEEKRKKNWLLNAETRNFLHDRTMWWLAAGFFLVTGPGEAYINNVGTVLGTLYPKGTPPEDFPTSAATHVSILAITSTLSRIFAGTITDLLSPTASEHNTSQHRRGPNSLASSLASLELPPSKRFTVSRVALLIILSLLLSIGQILLASGLFQNHSQHLWIVTALEGIGYGSAFSLTPIIVSVVWGVENFGTNWGIVAIFPAAGAAVWGIVYSSVYQAAAGYDGSKRGPDQDILCYGMGCYAPTFWAMAVSVWLACGLWVWAWRGPGGWVRRGIAV